MPNFLCGVFKLVVLISVSWHLFCDSQLVVNVKDGGGDVTVESFHGNTTSDIVQLQFLNKDGTHVTQFIDFKSVSLFPFKSVLVKYITLRTLRPEKLVMHCSIG